MGQSVSLRSVNDFELVVRATKEVEFRLEEHFGAPGGKTVGLHDKISAARDARGQPLPAEVVRKMRKLVTIRNALVHDRQVNHIADRTTFMADWKEVEAALTAAVPSRGTSCFVVLKLAAQAASRWHDLFVRRKGDRLCTFCS